MLARFIPTAVFRAHWKSLSDYREQGKPKPDYGSRAALLLVPLVLGALAWWFDVELRSPGAILTAVALLAGGFLAAFTHLSATRARLTERAGTWGEVERVDRDALDETCSHLLVAAYVSGLTAVVLVLGMNLASDENGALVGAFAVVATAQLAYIALVFMIALPRLYTSYASSNGVREELNGLYRD